MSHPHSNPAHEPNNSGSGLSKAAGAFSAAANEALLISGLREHELRQNAEHLAEALRIEIIRSKHSEDLVRASETKFRRLFETAESGFLTVDAGTMTITAANPFLCALVGRGPENLVGLNLWETEIFAHEEAMKAAFAILKETASVSYEDLPMRARSGSFVHVGFSANIYDEGGIQVIQCNVRDITESKRLLDVAQAASDAAQRANSAKDTFLAALSHELRTPLNPVMLLASENALDPRLSAEVRADFASIEKNVIVEARLIDDLLDLTRVSHGKLRLHMERVSVIGILRDAVANIQGQLNAKDLTLSMTGVEEDVFVNADALRIQQVFWNILSNAVKFTQPRGAISIQAAKDMSRGVLVLEFSDNGIGMNPSELERIFEPFKQVDQAGENGSNRYGGLGLGLAIAQKIIGLQSGSIRAESRGMGHGSVFRVELAFLPEPGSEPVGSAEPWPKIEPERRDGTSVLCVEDDASSRRTLARLLVARGFNVTSVGSFSDAEIVGLLDPFELLITDVGLPDRTGLDLLAICAQKSPGIRGIAISGYGTPADIARSHAAGFSAHIVKPISITALEAALPKALASTAPFPSIPGDHSEYSGHPFGPASKGPVASTRGSQTSNDRKSVAI
jgi:PAS domain S-box-containing protein